MASCKDKARQEKHAFGRERLSIKPMGKFLDCTERKDGGQYYIYPKTSKETKTRRNRRIEKLKEPVVMVKTCVACRWLGFGCTLSCIYEQIRSNQSSNQTKEELLLSFSLELKFSRA